MGAGDKTYFPKTIRAIIPPTVNDDDTAGYSFGDKIIDTVAKKIYMCHNPATGAAVWLLIETGPINKTLQLIAETVIVTPATSYTLSGLDGDVDGAYQFEAGIIIANGAASTALNLQINGDTGVNYSYARDEIFQSTNNVINAWGVNKIPLGFLYPLTHEAQAVITGKIMAKSGLNRGVCSMAGLENTTAGQARADYGSGLWLNTASNVTSLTFSTATNMLANSYIRIYAPR